MEHSGPISGIAYRNGFVATAGYDNQVILWDHSRQLAISRGVHDHLANHCAFNRDASLLASASSDHSVRLWSLPAMRLRAVLCGHDDDVEMVAFSPAGDRLATCSRDRTVRIWSLAGQCLGVGLGHEDDVISITWSADGREVLSSSDDGTVRRWDAASGAALGILSAAGAQTDTLVLRHDGVVFAGDDDGRIAVVREGASHAVQAHQAGIKRLVLSECGRRLASLSYDRRLALWEAGADGSLHCAAEVEFPAIVWPRSAAFAGDQELVLGTFGSTYARLDLSAMVWHIDHIRPDASINAVACVHGRVVTIGDAGVVHGLDGQARSLGSLCNFLLPFDGLLLTGGQLGILFDALTGDVLHRFSSPLNCAAAFEREGVRHVIVGTYTGEGLVFRRHGAGLELVGQWALHDNAVKGVAASGGTIFSVCASAAVAWHRSVDFAPIRRKERGHARIANGCSAIAGGFASIGRDRMLRLWSDRGDEALDSPHEYSIKCIASNPEGTRVCTGSYGGTVVQFDVPSRRWEATHRPTSAGISSITFDDRRGVFVAAGYDGTLFFDPA